MLLRMEFPNHISLDTKNHENLQTAAKYSPFTPFHPGVGAQELEVRTMKIQIYGL